MDKYIYVFHHTDLDGMGVKIMGLLYAMKKGLPCRTCACSYASVNNHIGQAIKNTADVEEIIIGDISVNEDIAERLEDVYRDGVPVRLRDHHDSADWLNKYEWAVVKECDDGGISRCGTWWLAQDDDMKDIANEIHLVIDAIDEWDTWRWKDSGNDTARNLNQLLSILGQDDFVDYIMSNYQTFHTPDDLFDADTKTMIWTYNRQLQFQVEMCEKFMYTMNLWTEIPLQKDGVHRKLKKTIKLHTGIVFCNTDLSSIGDMILDRNPELDILMVIAFPGTISWRTQKNLPISLAKIAKRATGKGGGHPSAAGSTIGFTAFKDMLIRFMDSTFSTSLDFSNLKSSWERKNDMEQAAQNHGGR